MIDYIKLKEAHELCEKYSRQCSFVRLGCAFVWQSNELRAHFDLDFPALGSSGQIMRLNSVDELITKLQELTQDKPKPKYEVGQAVWYIHDELYCPEKGVVKEIDRFSDETYFVDGDDLKGWWEEDKLYPSKQALIESQIEYWASLKNEEISTQESEVSTESTCQKRDYEKPELRVLKIKYSFEHE